MFFIIGKNINIQGLTQVSDNLQLDQGWSNQGDIWYKGYSTECVLSDKLYDIIGGYKPSGKWCVIYNDDVFHPVLRGFPLYAVNNCLTNLCLEDTFQLSYQETPYYETPSLTLEQATDKIGDILYENTVNFLKYNNILEKNLLFSAGLDTMTAWAILDFVTKSYNLEVYLPKSYDNTFESIIGRTREYNNEFIEIVSKKYWGYNIYSFKKNINWYFTGYDAEMIQFRDGEAINALANYVGKTIDTVASENDYLYWFLKRPALQRYNETKLIFNDENDLKKYLWSTIFYDFQYWHLDNNYGFSPFYDIRIPQIMLGLSVKDLVSNAVDAKIQKEIVKKYKPEILPLLSTYKNEKDVWGNFRKNWDSLVLDPKTKINLR
jgi:hypothetical protein